MEPSLQPPGRISCPRLTSLQWVLLKFLFPFLAMFSQGTVRRNWGKSLWLWHQYALSFAINDAWSVIFSLISVESPSTITLNWPAKRGKVVVTPLRTNSAKYYLTTSLYNCIRWRKVAYLYPLRIFKDLIGSSALGLLLSICICIGVYIYLQACPLHKKGLYGSGQFWTFLTGWGSYELFTSGGPSFGFGSAPPSFDCQVESYLCCFS